MADEVDKKAFDDMQAAGPKMRDFFKGDDYKEFDFDTFYEQGDSLYSVYADKSIPQYDPDFPDISMFDEEGGFTSEYSKKKYPNFEYTEDGITHRAASIRATTGSKTERQRYFRDKFNELEEGMAPMQQAEFARSIKNPYGDEPKYSKEGKLVSPYQSAKIYYDMTKDMDFKDKMGFDKNILEPFMKGLTTKK